MATDKVEVQYLPPEDLKFYVNNAKVHKRKMDMLRRSIQTFGFDVPVVIDEDGVILKGHGRVMAALSLGSVSSMKTIPVIIRAGLTTEEKKIVRLADNLSWTEGQDDEAKKADVLGKIDVEGMDLFYTLDSADVASPKVDLTPSESKPKPTHSFLLVTCPKCQKVHKEEK